MLREIWFVSIFFSLLLCIYRQNTLLDTLVCVFLTSSLRLALVLYPSKVISELKSIQHFNRSCIFKDILLPWT